MLMKDLPERYMFDPIVQDTSRVRFIADDMEETFRFRMDEYTAFLYQLIRSDLPTPVMTFDKYFIQLDDVINSRFPGSLPTLNVMEMAFIDSIKKSITRGKYLGTSITTSQKNAIRSRKFKDLRLS